MGKLRQTAEERFRTTAISGETLYDELREIDVYKNHREALRPWDRKLPAIVDQEANRRALWILKPPNGLTIVVVLALSILSLCLVASIPFAVNQEAVHILWINVVKPEVVYHDARVLFAVSIVCHACSGVALWMIFLSEGFSKHALELFPFGFTIFLDCIWADVVFSANRIDWAMMIWAGIVFFTFVTICLLVYKDVVVAGLFMLPSLAGSIGALVYAVEFYKKYGAVFPTV